MSTQRVAKALDPDRVRVGATLRALREKSGLRLGDMANAFKPPISYSYLSNIEAGRKPLTPILLAQAARLLDVPQVAIDKPGLVHLSEAA